MPHSLAYRQIWWRHFLTWGSLLLDDSSLCQIDKKLTALVRLTAEWRSRGEWISSQFMRKWVSQGEDWVWGHVMELHGQDPGPENKPFRNWAEKHTKESLPRTFSVPSSPRPLSHPKGSHASCGYKWYPPCSSVWPQLWGCRRILGPSTLQDHVCLGGSTISFHCFNYSWSTKPAIIIQTPCKNSYLEENYNFLIKYEHSK